MGDYLFILHKKEIYFGYNHYMLCGKNKKSTYILCFVLTCYTIYDTMNYIKCDVSTICMGMAASMGAFLFSAGTKGKRYILPNAEVMIHQPLGGAQGQATEILIAADHIKRTKERLNKILAENTGKTIEEIFVDTERDNWLTAEQAVEYGLADKIIEKR